MRHANMVKKRRSTYIFKTNALEILKILADTERKAPIKRRSLQALVIAPNRGEGESIPFMHVDQPELLSLLESEMDWLKKEGHNFELENEACGDPFNEAVSADETCTLKELVSAIIQNWSTLLNGFLESQAAAPNIIQTYQHVLTIVAINYGTTIHQIVTIEDILRLISRTIDPYKTRDMFTLYGNPLIHWYASTEECRTRITNRLKNDVEELRTKLGKPYDPSSTSTKEHDKLKEKKALAEKRMRFVSDAYPNDDSTPPTIW
ncbi:hypothetical protein CYMTET_38618 [Cymbomonas tetramitiformis]|uniref:Uncharacterized protein n=1 Tax=Cymbomonas tetramitiformis TaxID=36881 RepID=A0AAE0CDQ6_9CHLO|nr:hypothetical protein CYMTET_38618 [Cymbomonas tetramitiformis]